MLASHCIVVAHHLLDKIQPPQGWSKLDDVRVHADASSDQASSSIQRKKRKKDPASLNAIGGGSGDFNKLKLTIS